MRKLRLATTEIAVETFATGLSRDGENGTVQGNQMTANCTSGASCYEAQCGTEQPTSSPIYRQCYTPYVECSTQGYTCGFSCVSCELPLTSSC